MGCTTILVGKKASADGSTIMARTDDSGHGSFEAKRFEVIAPEDLPSSYRSVLSHVEIPLPENGLRYTRFPDADPHKGLWAGAGINSARVSMTATETLTTNERVLAADPLVELQEAEGKEGDDGYVPEKPGGIGEEDMVVLVLPYIRSAREGVLRLGQLLEEYGTYEMNGIGFADTDDVWWLETVGGHHWLARRLPEDCYAIIANQFSLDYFDFEDASGEGRDFLCSADLREFVEQNHLNTANPYDSEEEDWFNPRLAFGSRSDSDHVYNTPRVWALQRYFNPSLDSALGFDTEFSADSDDLDWCLIPERLITMEDVKYAESYHYQGTPFNPYARKEQTVVGGADRRGMYRPIGINRTNFVAALQLRPEMPSTVAGLNWVAYGAMPFNALVPFFANVRQTPEYLEATTSRVTTENHYCANRIIAALVDAHYHRTIAHVERYQQKVVAKALEIVSRTDVEVTKLGEAANDMENSQIYETLEKANSEIAEMLKRETDDLLDKVLFDASIEMHNAFSRDDA